MATYVTSDAHGHLRALDRALELAAPGADDIVYVLGDMVDRGPDPVGVMRLVRGLHNARVLMGNHEHMMLSTLATGDQVDLLTWEMNGGSATAAGLDACPHAEYVDLMDWVANLPLADAVHAGGRTYLLAHAGFDALELRAYLATAGFGGEGGYGGVPADLLARALATQDAENLLWIRGHFSGVPTGLLGRYADLMCGGVLDEGGRALMVEVGASWDTGGVADRVDIDCSAAAGAPAGRVGVLRLDDRRVFYADIEEGE